MHYAKLFNQRLKPLLYKDFG